MDRMDRTVRWADSIQPVLKLRRGRWLAVRAQASLWVWGAAALLALSSLLFMVAFGTNGWGVLGTTVRAPETGREEWWAFGLWQSCLHSDTPGRAGVCLGTRWARFYMAARIFAVLALVAHLATLCFTVGYTLEKIYDYDLCAMVFMIAMTFSAMLLTFITVMTFGVRWPVDFSREFQAVSTRLGYSFGLACACVVLTAAAGALCCMELRREYRRCRAPRPLAGCVRDLSEDLDTEDSGLSEGLDNKNYGAAGWEGGTPLPV